MNIRFRGDEVDATLNKTDFNVLKRALQILQHLRQFDYDDTIEEIVEEIRKATKKDELPPMEE